MHIFENLIVLYNTRNLLYLKRLKYSIKIQRIGTAKLYTPRTYWVFSVLKQVVDY